MHIQFRELPAVVNTLQRFVEEGKAFVAIHLNVDQLSVADLHPFKFREDGLGFVEFNETQSKEVYLFPTSAVHDMIQEFARQRLVMNPDATSTFLALRDQYEINLRERMGDAFNQFVYELDKVDWNRIDYKRGQSQFDNIESKIAYNRIDWLIDQLSLFCLTHLSGKEIMADILYSYWHQTPMEMYMNLVLTGQYAADQMKAYKVLPEENTATLKENDGDSYLQINYKQNNTNMNAENLEYLQKQMLYSGFGEGLNAQLEKKLKEGHPDFQIQASHEFGRDTMEAVLYFSRSKQDGSDKYFFNKYDATLNNDHGKFQQTFFINNKGQSITFREACNLLNGRSVYKELTPKEGARYKAWIKLDFSKRDEFNNAKLNIFNEKYGFDLKEALSRIPLKELGDPDKMAVLFTSLQRGDMVQATMVKPEKEMPVQIAADPKFKTIRMFDKEGTKLYVPAPKQEVQYGKAPVDDKRVEQGAVLEVGEPLNAGYQQKNDKGLPLSEKNGSKVKRQNRNEVQSGQGVKLNKKRTSNSKSRNIG